MRCSKLYTGQTLQRRLGKARKDYAIYHQLYNDFREDLQEDNVKEWTAQVLQWEKDTSLDDPYDLTSSGKCIAYSYVLYIHAVHV